MVRLEMLMRPDAGDRTVGLGEIKADKVEEYVSKPGHFKVGGVEGQGWWWEGL